MKIGREIQEIRERLDEVLQLLQAGQSPWKTTREAAHFLRCSESKVEQLTSRGLLPFRRLDPTAKRSQRLYHRRDLTAFLVTGRNPKERHLSAQERRMVEELL